MKCYYKGQCPKRNDYTVLKRSRFKVFSTFKINISSIGREANWNIFATKW